MAKRLQKQNLYETLVKFLGSKKFLWIVVGLFVLQSLWIALSFRYPMVYDETFHFPVIEIFSSHWSPLIFNQPQSYDTFGNLLHTNSPLYHYLMSFPYRFFSMFTDNSNVQIVLLRMLNIAMAAGGLVVFARVFREIDIKQSHINVGLLAFTMLPIVPFVAAHINYDNMLFLLTAAYLLFAVRVVRAKTINWSDYAWLMVFGLFASLAKYTFLPLFAVGTVYLSILLWRRHGKQFFPKLGRSIKKANRRHLALVVTALIILGGVFSATYLRSVIVYGSPLPKCQATMSKERCLTGRSGYLIKRAKDARVTKNERPLLSLEMYGERWFNNMWHGSVLAAANTAPENKMVLAKPMPIISSFVFFGFIIGAGLLLYAWRSLPKNPGWYFLLAMTATVFISVFLFNYKSHIETHAFYANQPRYLLSMVPVLSVMFVAATAYAFRKYNWIKVAIFTVAVLLMTQGGGVVTHIMRSEPSWYWQNPIVIDVNNTVKKVLKPIVYEGRSL